MHSIHCTEHYTTEQELEFLAGRYNNLNIWLLYIEQVCGLLPVKVSCSRKGAKKAAAMLHF